MPVDLPCHVCGYDLRAQPQDGRCPECGAAVAEARRMAAIPRRPAWRDSDPRWRRRMLAGLWILALVPLMEVLTILGWASSVRIPTPYDFHGTVRTLDHTLAAYGGVYQPLMFCIGVVLLFSKERGRHRNRLDWTRRWGVICTYVVLLISAAEILFIGALVLAGIAAVFQSMPLKYQPAVTPWFVRISSAYLLYGAYPNDTAGLVLVAFSSITILLACVALSEALASSGPRWLAATLLTPLAAFALLYLAQIGRYLLGLTMMPSEIPRYGVYFWPQVLRFVTGQSGVTIADSLPIAITVEVIKWCAIVGIAVWLSIAQFAARRRGRRADSHVNDRRVAELERTQ